MAKAAAVIRTLQAPAIDAARLAIVSGCALALILAERALPF